MRLTKKLRDEILEAAISKAMTPVKEAFNVKASAVADTLYEEECGAHLKTMKSLPSGYFNTANECSVMVKTSDQHWECPHLRSFDAACWRNSVKFSSSRLVPAEHGHSPDYKLNKKHKLAKKVIALAEEHDLIEAQEKSLTRDIAQLLESITTDKKLFDVWPEAKDYWPKSQAEPVTKALMIKPEDVTNKIKCLSEGNLDCA